MFTLHLYIWGLGRHHLCCLQSEVHLHSETHSQNLPGGPWIQWEQPCVHSTPSLHSHTDLEVRRNLCSLSTPLQSEASDDTISAVYNLRSVYLLLQSEVSDDTICCLQSEVRSTYCNTIWCLGRYHLETTSCLSVYNLRSLLLILLLSGVCHHYNLVRHYTTQVQTSQRVKLYNEICGDRSTVLKYLKLSEVPNTV